MTIDFKNENNRTYNIWNKTIIIGDNNIELLQNIFKILTNKSKHYNSLFHRISDLLVYNLISKWEQIIQYLPFYDLKSLSLKYCCFNLNIFAK